MFAFAEFLGWFREGRRFDLVNETSGWYTIVGRRIRLVILQVPALLLLYSQIHQHCVQRYIALKELEQHGTGNSEVV
jgi:hypothetical protein